MPTLPLENIEPFTATLGVMLYPGTSEIERLKARAFAAQALAEPIRRLHETGQKLSHEILERIVVDAGQRLTDLDKRWWGGSAVGEAFKTLRILAHTHPALASWNNAIEYVESFAKRSKKKGSRTNLWEARGRFLSVAHLWGAWSFRDRRILDTEDFQIFLAQAEELRKWGQSWKLARAKSEPLLPPDVWQVPKSLNLPKPDWPDTQFALDPKLVALLEPAGRPRKRL